jgi:hypothetical protein
MTKQKWRNHDKFDTIAIADSDTKKWGCEMFGKKVIPPEDIKKMEFDAIVITTEPHYFDIKKELVYDLYLDERKIWRIDEFVVALNKL